MPCAPPQGCTPRPTDLGRLRLLHLWVPAPSGGPAARASRTPRPAPRPASLLFGWVQSRLAQCAFLGGGLTMSSEGWGHRGTLASAVRLLRHGSCSPVRRLASLWGGFEFAAHPGRAHRTEKEPKHGKVHAINCKRPRVREQTLPADYAGGGGGAGPSEGQRPATTAGAGPGPSQGDAGAAMLAAAGSTLQAARLLLLQRVPRAVPRPLGPRPSPRGRSQHRACRGL